jgi:predicted GIY-YIG superfamily endonuclease
LWFVYLLRCWDNSLYCGITNNIDRRIEQHNKGIASKYTRGRLPVKLVYLEVMRSRSEASKRESSIKRLSKIEKEKLIGGSNEAECKC